jgi:hypothetical protein
METDDNKTPKVPATTPPIAPTEPSPIPVDFDNPAFEESNTKNDVSSPVYYCPMHCEGDKTYSQPGNCPICGMKLVTDDIPK